MVGKYSIEELELNSQVQLLSRIQFVMRFSSNLVQVVGENGAGKTWLSECYLEKWATETTQTLLLCNQNQRDEQHRAIILRQIVPEGVFNAQDPIVQSLSTMLKDDAIHALIVIDDAHLLSANLAKELWQLVSVAQERVGWQINVLLFSEPSKLNKSLQKAAKHQKEKPIEMDITPLNESERELLTSSIIQSFQMDGAGRRAFKIRVQNADSTPGAIIDSAYPKLAGYSRQKSRSLFIPITVTILLLVLGATLAFWLQIPKGMSPGQYLAKLWSNFSEKKDPNIPKIDINSLAQEDRITLPEQPYENEMSVGYEDNDGKKSIVLDGDTTDAMEDAMLKEQNKQENQDNKTKTATLEKKGQPSSTEGGLDVSKLSDILSANNKGDVPEDFPNIPIANTMLLNVPSSRYALQLGAFQTQHDLRAFIHQYDLLGRVLVYETLRGGAPWYMVLLGDYPSVVEARRTELQLSENLRNLGPWAKSFTQIHKEISLVN